MKKLKTIIKKLLVITLSFCLTANTALANTYKETQQNAFFRTRDNYKNHLSQTFYDDKHKLYSLLYYQYGDLLSFNDTLYLIKWNKDGHTTRVLKIPKKISNEISKYNASISTENPITSSGNIWMKYSYKNDKSNNWKNFFIRISPKGKLLSKINLKKIFNIPRGENDVYYKIHQYKKNKAFVQIHIDKLKQKDIYMAGVIDYKKNKLVWKRKVSDNEGFFKSYSLYDYSNTAKNKYMAGFNKAGNKFVISGIKNGKIIQELDLDAEEENIVSYEYKNNAIYIVKKDGVYKLKWNEDKMDKLIDLQNHWLGKGHNYAADITVVNDNEIYITGSDPFSENEDTILFSFKKNV
ncbi:MAG: hypothetical protein HFH68_14170 [Lachnospiraceae bacterium]|nr:hypothetical protein [Lachnospiraceae bacterium]